MRGKLCLVLTFVMCVQLRVCYFPIGVLGQVWYLIVSIPVLCILTYFSEEGLLITLLEWCPCSHVAICVLRQLENLKPIRVRRSVMHEKVK